LEVIKILFLFTLKPLCLTCLRRASLSAIALMAGINHPSKEDLKNVREKLFLIYFGYCKTAQITIIYFIK